MPYMTLTLVVLAALMFIIGVPIAASLGFSAILALAIFSPIPTMQIIPQLFSEAATSFVLLAVPLFIFAGFLMERGTVGKNLIDFCSSLVGWTVGGLGNAGIFGSMIFGGISGSSLADTATFGTVLVPRMSANGYPKDYATAVVLTSSDAGCCHPSEYPPGACRRFNGSVRRQSAGRWCGARCFHHNHSSGYEHLHQQKTRLWSKNPVLIDACLSVIASDLDRVCCASDHPRYDFFRYRYPRPKAPQLP